MIKTYKILTGKEKVVRNDFFKLQTRNFHNTREYNWRPCSDFMDMLRRLISCRIIIIIIIIQL